jgi:hypothetical protein
MTSTTKKAIENQTKIPKLGAGRILKPVRIAQTMYTIFEGENSSAGKLRNSIKASFCGRISKANYPSSNECALRYAGNKAMPVIQPLIESPIRVNGLILDCHRVRIDGLFTCDSFESS